MTRTLVIPRRFNGPPDSANGGYAAGLVAGLLENDAEVTLRSPPPLDRPLAVVETNTSVEVRDGDTLVALGEAVEWQLDVPAPVGLAEAEEARKRYPGFTKHAYATCFACGPDRADGLAIFPGPVGDRELVAAPWVPPIADVPREFVWAALDCPSGWAIDTFNREGVLLGKIAARVRGPVTGGSTYVVVGWPRGEEGRKRYAGSAIFTGDGELVAYARSTWIVAAAATSPGAG